MLIRITNSCRMGCTHCMVSAIERSDQHMSLSTFEDAIKFIIKLEYGRAPLIMISGGEPTDNPDFLKILKIIHNHKIPKKAVSILSNGMFLDNEDYSRKILEYEYAIQITNDERYYPKKVKILKNDLIYYEHNIRQISPEGRALVNNIPSTRKTPACFNIRSLVDCGYSLSEATYKLKLLGKFCTPSINFDGTISAGENVTCSRIGGIYSDPKTIRDNIKNMSCGKCGLHKNLKDEFLELWNKMEGN